MNEHMALPAATEANGEIRWTSQRYYGLTGITWFRIGLVAALLAGVFWPNLRRLWLKTNPLTGEANWGHAFFVPLIGLYYLYLNRGALLSGRHVGGLSSLFKALGVWIQMQLVMWGSVFFVWLYYPLAFDRSGVRLLMQGVPAGLGLAMLGYVLFVGLQRGREYRPAQQRLAAIADRSATWFGWYTLSWGLLFYAWSIWPGQNDFFKDCSMVVTLFGIVLLLCGWTVMRLAWFPIVFLVCAFPWPQLMYSRIAMPLQELAASAAVLTLQGTGVDASRQGTQILIGSGASMKSLNVAEACAGIKSLMTFVTLAAAVGFLSARPLWQKLIISASAVPIAIFCNMMRVAGQGLLHHYVSERLSESFAHQFVGVIMLIPAFFLIWAVGWVLEQLFIEETDERAVANRIREQSNQVIEIPRTRGGARVAPAAARVEPPAAAPAPGASQASDLATATLRMMSAQAARRHKGGVAAAPSNGDAAGGDSPQHPQSPRELDGPGKEER